MIRWGIWNRDCGGDEAVVRSRWEVWPGVVAAGRKNKVTAGRARPLKLNEGTFSYFIYICNFFACFLRPWQGHEEERIEEHLTGCPQLFSSHGASTLRREGSHPTHAQTHTWTLWLSAHPRTSLSFYVKSSGPWFTTHSMDASLCPYQL